MDIKEEGSEGECAEDVNRIANPGIDAVGDKAPGLRAHRERVTKLDAGEDKKRQRRQSDDCPGNPHGGPGFVAGENCLQSEAEQDNDKGSDVCFHGV